MSSSHHDSPALTRYLTGPLVALSATRVNLQLALACDWLVAVALCAMALRTGTLGPAAAVFIVVIGWLAFSLMEYVAHRWLFHARHGPFRAGHERHHDCAGGYDALPFFLPPLIMCALAWVAMLVLPSAQALLLAGAIALGYAIYGSCHVILHVHQFRHWPLRQWQHFHDVHHLQPDRNFGVTTGLWDWVFSTLSKDDGENGNRGEGG